MSQKEKEIRRRAPFFSLASRLFFFSFPPPSPRAILHEALLLTLKPAACDTDFTHPFAPCLPSSLQLASTEEYIDGQFAGNLGEVLIRCVHERSSPATLKK